ncbi:MAG TPA: hypothetical protein VMM81_08650 [Acidimicrobiia bacterium]|nr:hypothetical protein [Acidimicrobiia bacterium]
MSDALLGSIVRLQVQRDPLKTRGEGYDPTPILAVDEAAIGPLGMVGRHDGAWVVDAHHGAHPRSRAGGRRALSIGFTAHYAAMADRFGSAPLGCAGENIIVETDRIIRAEDLEGDLLVTTGNGELRLMGARVATPCLEFTSFLLGRPAVASRSEIAADVASLDEGVRGFILEVAHLGGPVVIRVGDPVSVRAGFA